MPRAVVVEVPAVVQQARIEQDLSFLRAEARGPQLVRGQLVGERALAAAE